MKLFYTLLFAIALASNVSFAQTLMLNSSNQIASTCPLMEVNIAPSSEKSKDIFVISYCNRGNEVATDAYVEVEVASGAYIVYSSIPHVRAQGRVYIYNLDDVAKSACGEFVIEIRSYNNLYLCTNVHIYPDDPCQAMMDLYLTSNGTRTENENNNDNDNNTGNTTVDTSDVGVASTIVIPGMIQSVFEDNVMLSKIPSWDSLLAILTYPSTGGDSTSIPRVNNEDNNGGANNNNNGSININTLASAVHCRKKTFDNNNDGGTLEEIPFSNVLINLNSNALTTVNGSGKGDDKTGDGETGKTINKKNGNKATNPILQEQEAIDLAANAAVVVKVYPNPFKDYTTIEIQGASYNQIHLELIDVTGRIVKTLQAQAQQQLILHRENLSPGVYFYRLNANDQQLYTGKIVVQ